MLMRKEREQGVGQKALDFSQNVRRFAAFINKTVIGLRPRGERAGMLLETTSSAVRGDRRRKEPILNSFDRIPKDRLGFQHKMGSEQGE
jgi:hypothetical protein